MATLFEAAVNLQTAGAYAQTDFDTADTYDHTEAGLVVSSDDFTTWAANRTVTPEMRGNVAVFDETSRVSAGGSKPNRMVRVGRVIYVAEFQDEAGDTKTLSYVENY